MVSGRVGSHLVLIYDSESRDYRWVTQFQVTQRGGGGVAVEDLYDICGWCEINEFVVIVSKFMW